MDLLNLEGDALYFDEPLTPALESLLMQSASAYGTPQAELHLLRAHLLAPENLRVLVALFRHYHRVPKLPEASTVAERLMQAAGESLGFPADWRRLDRAYLTRGVGRSFGLVRFYLLAMKARASVGLRLKQVEIAREMLFKVREMDDADRLGAAALLAIVDHRRVPASGVSP